MKILESACLPYNNDVAYRQRITLRKVDEDGEALPKVNFRFTAKNNKELYSYKFNGWGDAESGDADDGLNTLDPTIRASEKKEWDLKNFDP